MRWRPWYLAGPMKRAAALLLALAALLAHALAIHLDEGRRFGVPYDSVHVAYRLARNLVREGELVWNVGLDGAMGGGLGCYPSPLWVAVVAGAESRWIFPTLLTQWLGVLAALATVAVATLATAALVFGLSLRLRRRELLTLSKIGGARGRIATVLAAEVLVVLVLGAAMAAGLTQLTRHFGTELIQKFIVT